MLSKWGRETSAGINPCVMTQPTTHSGLLRWSEYKQPHHSRKDGYTSPADDDCVCVCVYVCVCNHCPGSTGHKEAPWCNAEYQAAATPGRASTGGKSSQRGHITVQRGQSLGSNIPSCLNTRSWITTTGLMSQSHVNKVLSPSSQEMFSYRTARSICLLLLSYGLLIVGALSSHPAARGNRMGLKIRK